MFYPKNNTFPFFLEMLFNIYDDYNGWLYTCIIHTMYRNI